MANTTSSGGGNVPLPVGGTPNWGAMAGYLPGTVAAPTGPLTPAEQQAWGVIEQTPATDPSTYDLSSLGWTYSPTLHDWYQQAPDGSFFDINGNKIAPSSAKSTPTLPSQPIVKAQPTAGPSFADIQAQRSADAALAQAKAQEQYYRDQLALQKKQAEEQHKMDMDNAINNYNKQWEDYANAHYYGAMYGPGYFLNPGAAQPIARPIPSLVQEWYQQNHQALPTAQAAPYAGYTGSLYVNAEHPGLVSAPPGNIDPVTGQKLAATSVPSTGPSTGNHVPSIPLGPELTGLSGFGSLVTANGTPIPLSDYQKSHLDDTSLQHYASYLGDVAGFNPKDFMGNIPTSTTGLADNLSTPGNLRAPTNFNNAQVLPPVLPQ